MNETWQIPARVHGRVLRSGPASPRAVLVGFHGYGENAETMLARLEGVPLPRSWGRVSVQGLHRFYRRRTGDVVASWMTRQDRELAITDNRAYGLAVLERLRADCGAVRVALAGFSQGVAMAYRVAAAGAGAFGVVVVGGDLPPDLGREILAGLPPVLLARGERDPDYPATQLAADARRLADAGVPHRSLQFDGGHEWTEEFATLAGVWLRERRRSRRVVYCGPPPRP